VNDGENPWVKECENPQKLPSFAIFGAMAINFG
jgi:hypothetical protein